MKKKTILTLWSGGIDSTCMIYRYLKQGYSVRAIYISLQNNTTKTDMECDAIKKLEPLLMQQGDFQFLGNACSVNIHLVKDTVYLHQIPIWLLGTLYSIPDEIDTIAIGYIMNDDAVSFLSDIQKIYKSYAPIIKRKLPKLEFPMIKSKKHEFISELPREIWSLCVRCENPKRNTDGTFTPCHHCLPCEHWNEVCPNISKEETKELNKEKTKKIESLPYSSDIKLDPQKITGNESKITTNEWN